MRRPPRALLIVIFVVAAYWMYGRTRGTTESGRSPATADVLPARAGEGAARIVELFAARESGVVVEASGAVDRLLPDDDEGSRHQRFIVRLPGGATVLLSHNIDLAPRLEDLAVGDAVSFRGQYEWNERGGVVHWTHHDPDGRRSGGWIEHAGERYR